MYKYDKNLEIKDEKILLEYVSANPTGILHLLKALQIFHFYVFVKEYFHLILRNGLMRGHLESFYSRIIIK